jgi:uncharacterized membrane protein YcaP (DUF421 family)
MDEIWSALADIEGVLRSVLGIGLESQDINAAQMGLRAAVIYITTVVIVRLGKKRFMGQATAFDVILGIMLGSVVSRAITGNAPLLPALAAAAVLVAMHSLFSAIAVRWHGFGSAIKGEARLLIEDGQVDKRAMRRAHMTDKDLWEDLRAKSVSRLEEVAEGRLERSGNLSVIKAKGEPKVVDIRVAEGVQTVRLELG